MPILPGLTEQAVSRINTSAFAGYNHKLSIAANEWYDMQNLSGDAYPLLASRAKRGVVSTLTAPSGITAKDALLYVDGTKVVYNGSEIDMGLSTDADMCPKQLISMGAYLVIFPDKKYLNTVSLTDFGSIDATFSITGGVSYSICNADGTGYGTTVASVTAPGTPVNGTLWIDTSAAVHILKQYSASASMWVEIPTVYTMISAVGIGTAFSKGDGVTLSGCTGNAQITALNKTAVIFAKGDNYIVVVGLLDSTYTQETGTVTVSRSAPTMDYVCEAQNRIWGCKYGISGGKTVNELYCCKLGDFKNWNVFSGISTDSWAASVGSDGVFTGAVNYLGYPTFFKENVIHRISVSSSGAHQVSDTVTNGVQKGSWRSLQVVGTTLYYKGRTGVYAYAGSMPTLISDAFGGVSYYDAVGGKIGAKYYLSMRDSGSAWKLFVYDTTRGFWHIEDGLHAMMFTANDDELYCIDEVSKKLIAMTGKQGTLENPVSWEAVSGIQYYDTPDHKYISRFNLRMQVAVGSTISLFIQYDSSGEWISAGNVYGSGIGVFTLPVRPRRCDHVQLKLTGTGDFRLFSMARIMEEGSDMG